MLGLGFLGALVACSPGVQPDSIVFQMDWTHEAEFVGFYAAEAQGFFRDAGLTVTLVEGPAGTDVPGILTSGKADAAQMGAVMFQVASQASPDLVAVMAVLQTSPRVLMTRVDQGVHHPRDLEGLRVGVKSGSWAGLVKKIMVNAGADPSKIIQVPVKNTEVERFYRGEVDVWTGFATSEPVDAELAAHPVNLLYADDYGAGGYDELVVLRRSELEKNKDKWRRFAQALVKGWTWAGAHTDAVIGLLDTVQPQASHRFHTLAWKALRPLVITGKDPVGWIQNVRWSLHGPFAMDLLESP